MKKLSKLFLSVLVSVFGVMLFIQRADADVIMPGQNPSGHGRGYIEHEPVSQLPTYIFTGVIIVIVIIVSIIILNKIRKKK